MDKNDTIRFVVSVEKSSDQQCSYVDNVLEINDSPFHPEFALDLTELTKSCQFSGELDIFTCGCGIPMCAGIYQCIRVEHLANAIVWRFNEPMSDKDYKDLDDDEWENLKKTVEFRFDPEHYLVNITAGINKLKALVVSSEQPLELPIHGFTQDALLALQPRVFSTRMNVAGKRLIAQNIEISAYNNLIYAGGMEYRLDDLFLPSQLNATYKKWQTYCTFSTVEDDLPAYLIFLQKGREFCQSLKQYLGGETNVKFKYRPPEFYNSIAWEVVEEIK